VVQARAELVGRAEEHRGRHAVVVARGFGPPATTAECAAPLLRVGGVALISDPPAPDRSVRWPSDALATLGLRIEELRVGPPAVAELRSVAPCPARFPRRDGVPRRRPLWTTEVFHVEPSTSGIGSPR
jgi:16S rRNA (guanine527-N7)-methyltransferase